MLMLIYDIVWWGLFLYTGFFAFVFILIQWQPASADPKIDSMDLFGAACLIAFVMMFLSIDKQLLI